MMTVFPSISQRVDLDLHFQRKQSEGKNRPQPLVCVMRRLVDIIYGMLKNKTEYKEPELSKEKAI